MPEPEIIAADPFDDEDDVGGNGSSHALALPGAEKHQAGDAIRAAVEATVKAEAGKMAAQMETRWLEERAEREKWVESDDDRKERMQRKNARQRIAAMMAAALVSEGAVGTRYTAKQIASYAIEVADEVMKELDRTDKLHEEYKKKDHEAVGGRCPTCHQPQGHHHHGGNGKAS